MNILREKGLKLSMEDRTHLKLILCAVDLSYGKYMQIFSSAFHFKKFKNSKNCAKSS